MRDNLKSNRPQKRIKNIVRIACALAMLGIAPVYASEYIGLHVPNAQPVGEGRLRVFFMDVYDATLFAPNGQFKGDEPFAIRLNYLRNITSQQISDRSAEEIRNQGFRNEVKLASWHSKMRRIFPDVKNGTVLTGIYTKEGVSIFYLDGKESGRITDPDFGIYFFNIWLGENTSAPTLRRRLLGAL
ncbi:MAG: chalcone isomerase family protein [Alphaproteobacteria bacterium]